MKNRLSAAEELDYLTTRNNMIKTIIRMLTPFIISVVDIIDGVLLFLELFKDIEIDGRFYKLLSHCTGSSILLISYILLTSTHMCKYYKTACYLILLLHLYTIFYLYTDITIKTYLYLAIVLSLLSLVCWTISVLGHKTYKTIHQACKREQTE